MKIRSEDIKFTMSVPEHLDQSDWVWTVCTPSQEPLKMVRATYAGPRKNLRGKTALVIPVRGDNSKVRAQFDDRQIASRGVLLGFNWHRFDQGHFRKTRRA